MAMNWTGGTRNRAKTSTNSLIQKRYFAKVRARTKPFVIPSAEGNAPSLLRRRKRATPEFDIIVKKARTIDGEAVRVPSFPPLPVYRSDEMRRGKKREEDIKKVRRRMLLEKDDWVCTALSKPLVLKKPEIGGQKSIPQRNGKYNHEGVGGGCSPDSTTSEDEDEHTSTITEGEGGREISTECEDEQEPVAVEYTSEVFSQHDEDIYIRIGGSTQRSSAPSLRSTGSTEPVSWSRTPIPTEIRGSSADTMLLDFVTNEPIFQFRHITPALSDIIQRKRREIVESGYSTSPLAEYSRRRGGRASGREGEDSGDSEGDYSLTEEADEAFSAVPSSVSMYSTIRVQQSLGIGRKRNTYEETEDVVSCNFLGGSSTESSITDENRRGGVLKHICDGPISALQSSEISWSLSPAEPRPHQSQVARSSEEAGLYDSRRGLSTGSSITEQNHNGGVPGCTPDVPIIVVESSEIPWSTSLAEPGPYQSSSNRAASEIAEIIAGEDLLYSELFIGGTGTLSSSGVEAEVVLGAQREASSTQECPDEGSRRDDEDAVKDTRGGGSYNWDEGNFASTEELLDTMIYLGCNAFPRDNCPGRDGPGDNDPITLQQACSTVQNRSDETREAAHGQGAGVRGDTQGSLGFTIEDEEIFAQNDWLEEALALASPSFGFVKDKCASKDAAAKPSRGFEEELETEILTLAKGFSPPQSRKKEGSAGRFIILEREKQAIPPLNAPQRTPPFWIRRSEQPRTHQESKELSHPGPEDITSPIAIPVARFYTRPGRLSPMRSHGKMGTITGNWLRENEVHRESGGARLEEVEEIGNYE